MAIFALTETAPTAPKPTNTASMFPASTQSTNDGNCQNTKVALPGATGGGGAGTFRWLGPAQNNTVTTNQGEPNSTTVTGFGWVLSVSQTGVLMPASSIASGQWVIRAPGAASVWSGTVAVLARVWQISADRSTRTLITLPGADANGWVISATGAPNTAFAITVNGVGAVTFDPSTPYLYLELIVKIVTRGTVVGQLTLSSSGVNISVPAVNYGRSSSDSGTFTDSANRANVLPRTATDTATFTDAASRVALRARDAADTLTLSDAASRVVAGARSANDSVTFGDSATRAPLSYARSAPDTFAFSDTAVRVAVRARSSSDAGTFSDAAGRSVMLTRSTIDTAALTDDASRSVRISRSAADSASFSASVTRSVVLTRAAADSGALTDTAVRTLIGARFAADTLSLTHSAARSVSLSRSTADTLAFADAASRVVAGARTASDTAAFTDTAARLVDTARFATDTLALMDTAGRANQISRGAIDALLFADSAVRVVLLHRHAEDNLGSGDGGGGPVTIIGRSTLLRRMGGLVPLNPGQVVPIEPTWTDTSGNPVSPIGAVVSFRDFSTGSARYWTGTAWTSNPTTLPTTSGRYVLTVPASWLGLAVAVTASLTGQPDLTDTYVVDDTTTSRSTAAALADVQADTDALQTDTATLLSRVDTTVSSRSSASALSTVQADTDDLQASVASLLTNLATVLTRTDVATSSRASAASVAALGSPAQQSSVDALATAVTALGTPAQASALAALVTAVGSPAQAAQLALDVAALLAEVDTRATPADVQVTVTDDSYGGRTA